MANEKLMNASPVLDLEEKAQFQNDSVSVIIALLNLEDSVELLYDSLTQSLKRYGKDFEIIFVDDGSVDGTFAKLSQIVAKDARAKLIKMRSTFGESSAFDAGLHSAKGNVIVYFTGRVRIDPRDIPKLLKKLEDGSDLVIGWRSPRRDSKLNQIISKLFNFIVRSISKLKLHDVNSGIIVAKRSIFESTPFYGNLNSFLPILASRQGYKVTEEKISQLSGSFRQSRYLKEYLQRALDIITVIFLSNYSKKPLHFLGFVGAVFSLVGLGINIYLFIYRFFGFGGIAGRPLLLLGALLLVIGIQMISIGLIGEMIIFTHAKDIKEYNIEKIIE